MQPTREHTRDERDSTASDMAGRDEPEVHPADPNTNQLRDAMRSGRTPTIASAREPAAAPFDTDDEAAGRPAQAAAVEQAMAHEGRLPAQTSASGARAGLPGAVWIIAGVLVLILLLWLLVL